jgi:uncharacterized protein (DUF433 family)
VAFERISVNHRIMGGLPCIKGTRIPVTKVVGLMADGMSSDEIIAEFLDLTEGDLRDALRYAAAAVARREPPPLLTKEGAVNAGEGLLRESPEVADRLR